MLVALCRSRAIDARVPSVRAGGAGGFTGATSPTGPALGPRGPEFSRDLRRCPGRAKSAAQVASQEQPRRPDRRSSSTAQAAPKSPATDADVPIVPSRRRRWLHRSNLAHRTGARHLRPTLEALDQVARGAPGGHSRVRVPPRRRADPCAGQAGRQRGLKSWTQSLTGMCHQIEAHLLLETLTGAGHQITAQISLRTLAGTRSRCIS